MSMHLVGPYLTTTKYGSKKKKSNSKRLAESEAKHNAWLAKQGLTPNQLKLKKEFVGNVRINTRPDLTTSNPYQLSNSVGNGYKKGIMENLHKESPEVQKEIMLKASRCMPLFNKGGLQYATPGEDMTQVGSKSRRG
jgi:hypothetical protein